MPVFFFSFSKIRITKILLGVLVLQRQSAGADCSSFTSSSTQLSKREESGRASELLHSYGIWVFFWILPGKYRPGRLAPELLVEDKTLLLAHPNLIGWKSPQARRGAICCQAKDQAALPVRVVPSAPQAHPTTFGEGGRCQEILSAKSQAGHRL